MSPQPDRLRALRRSWTRTAVAEACLIAVAQGVVVAADPRAWPGLLLVAPAALATLVAGWRAAAGIGDPAGDLLLESGDPFSSRAVLAADRVGRLVAAAWIGVVAGDLVTTPGALPSVALVAATAVVWFLARHRRSHASLLRSHVAMLEGRLDEARRHLADVESPALALAAEGTRIALLQRTGDGSDGVHAVEARWTGGLDAVGAAVAGARLARSDDADLARRWLAAERPEPTVYERLLAAGLAAHVALVEGRPEDALRALDGAPPVPPLHARGLALARLAALRASGREDEARALRDALDPPWAAEAWRRAAEPAFWRRLTGEGVAAAAAAPAPPPTETQPFAAPVEGLAPAAGPSRWVGVVPVERMVVFVRRSPTAHRVRAVALLTLLVLGPVLLALAALIATLGVPGDQPLVSLARGVGWLGFAMGSAGSLTFLVPSRGRPAFRTDDGRTLPTWWWWVLGSQQLGGGVGLVGLVWSVSWVSSTAWAVAAVGAPVLGWWAWRTLRRWRLLRDAHDPDPARILAWQPAGAGPELACTGAWRALGHLRAGDAAAALDECRAARLHGNHAAFVQTWVSAGRGELPVRTLLALPTPDDEASRYRAAVTLALAALAAGETAAVRVQLGLWDELAAALPNVYGDLLAALVERHRRRAGEPPRPLPEHTAWIDRVWPALSDTPAPP